MSPDQLPYSKYGEWENGVWVLYDDMGEVAYEDYSETCKQAGGMGATLKDLHGWLENVLECQDA